MKAKILLHSSTGNTRLVAMYCASVLRDEGVECGWHDIVKQPSIASVDDADLLVVACPTMYFRPTFAMERFIMRMPVPTKEPKPAFLLSTAAGEPGAFFWVLAELLANKGYVVLGGHWVIFPTNWPPHILAMQKLEGTHALGLFLNRQFPSLRYLWASLWFHLGEPTIQDREELRQFILKMIYQAKSGNLDNAPAPNELHKSMPLMDVSGLLMTVDKARIATNPKIIGDQCNACGICVKVCPVDCITQTNEETTPQVGANCTGCWACYNKCPEDAISGWASPPGKGRYRGPPRPVKRLFTQR